MKPGTFRALLATAALVLLACFSPFVMRGARAFPNSGGTAWWYLPSTSPTLNPAWLTQNWFIDGNNSTGCASDANTGTCPGCNTCGNHWSGDGPLASWRELHDHRWACLGGAAQCPRVTDTNPRAVVFLSGISDTINYNGVVEASGGSVALEGIPTVVATGVTLANVTAKNRNTPQLLQANLGASGAVGQFVVNLTHPSGAYAVKSLGSNIFALSQPLTGATIPTSGVPTEVNTWTNGDSVQLETYPSVTISTINPTGSASGSAFYLQSLSINVLNGGNMNLGGAISLLVQQSSIGGSLSNSNPTFAPFDMVNCDVSGSVNLEQYEAQGAFGIFGGDFRTSGGRCINCNPDLDTLFLSSMTGTFTGAGLVYLDTAVTMTVLPGDPSSVGACSAGGTGVVWGPGTLSFQGQQRFTFPNGADGGRATFLQGGGFSVNGYTVGCLERPDAGVTPCNVSITPATLDTNLGANTGCLGVPGGASICNGGQ